MVQNKLSKLQRWCQRVNIHVYTNYRIFILATILKGPNKRALQDRVSNNCLLIRIT